MADLQYRASPYMTQLADGDFYKPKAPAAGPVETPDKFDVSMLDEASTDVNTVDRSVAMAEAANKRALETQKRNQRRYNVNLNPAQQAEQSRLSQFQGQANVAGASTGAMRSDAALNSNKTQALTSLLQNFYKSNLSNLLGLENIETQRQNAYQKDRGAAKSQYYGFMGKVGSILGKI